jgi:hypothetical protein
MWYPGETLSEKYYMGSEGGLYLEDIDWKGWHMAEQENAISMLSTRREDKNDVEMWAGDFIKDSSGDIGIIAWNDYWAGLVIYYYKSPFDDTSRRAGLLDMSDFQKDELEKLGNKYENPELLKGVA